MFNHLLYIQYFEIEFVKNWRKNNNFNFNFYSNKTINILYDNLVKVV